MDRPMKGKSVIALPSDYVLLDVETTGLDYEYCHIIEVSAIKVSGGNIIDRFSSLVLPYPGYVLDPYITDLTGITDMMLQNAPAEKDVISNFCVFVGNSIVIAHNANFDVNFIYDACSKVGISFKNNYIDTLRIFRKVLPDLPHHRLSDVAKELKVDIDGQHRGDIDCDTAFLCYQKVREKILSVQTEEEFVSSFKRKKHNLNANEIIATVDEFDETHPLFGQTVVFTGAMSNLPRRTAMQMVANVGGINANSVTKKTNYLVVGSEEFASCVKNGKTSKMKKAEEYRLKGCDISIISENTFLDMMQSEI